ncbi:MAG: hypothetical protein ACLVL2_07355 [Bacteroides cellulosilyticus]
MRVGGKMASLLGEPDITWTDLTETTKLQSGYASEEAEMEALFKKMQTKYVSQGIPVILGEFGANRRSSLTGDELTKHLASRAYYLKSGGFQCTGSMVFVPFYWDNGYIMEIIRWLSLTVIPVRFTTSRHWMP